MDSTPFPVIDLVATGSNIQRLRQERGLTVRDLQRYFGFEEPRAIYKWQKGETLPTVDNLYALGILLEVPMDGILVPAKRHSAKEQRETRCSGFFGSANVRLSLLCFRQVNQQFLYYQVGSLYTVIAVVSDIRLAINNRVSR